MHGIDNVFVMCRDYLVNSVGRGKIMRQALASEIGRFGKTSAEIRDNMKRRRESRSHNHVLKRFGDSAKQRVFAKIGHTIKHTNVFIDAAFLHKMRQTTPFCACIANCKGCRRDGAEEVVPRLIV